MAWHGLVNRALYRNLFGNLFLSLACLPANHHQSYPRTRYIMMWQVPTHQRNAYPKRINAMKTAYFTQVRFGKLFRK